MNTSRTEKTTGEIGSLENTIDAPGPHMVTPPYPGNEYLSKPEEDGRFEIRDPAPTIDDGWDVVGTWKLSEEDGIILLTIGLAPSRLVTDGAPPGKVRFRDLPDEYPKGGVGSADLSRIRFGQVRSVIHQEAARRLEDPFFRLPPDSKPGDPAYRLVAGFEAVAASRETRGRPPKSDSELDQWARDVLEALSDDSQPIYWTLEDKWGVSDHTVKNHRLPRLKKTGRLVGRGRKMIEGPNYPRDEDTDNG